MLIPYTFIIRIAAFFLVEGPEDMSASGVLYNIFAKSFENQVALSIITINLVIAFTAILVNRIVIVHRLTRYQTLIPGLVYVLLVSWIESYLAFTPIHIANFFVMIGILSLFKFSKKTTSGIVVFDASFYFGLSGLFYTPYFIYIIIAILGFLSLNRFRFRDLINSVVGFWTPYFIVGGLLYYNQGTFSLFDGFEVNTIIFQWISNLKLLDLIPIIFYVLIIVISILGYGRLISQNSLIIQKKINFLYLFLAFSGLTLFFINEENFAHFLIFTIPTSILLGMMIERAKAPAIEEFLHVMIVALIFFLHFNNSVNIAM
jgi:hypothetical protein